MTDTLLKHLVLIFGLTVFSFQLQAATATTTVSANIVPISSLVMTGSIVLGEKFDTYRDRTKIKANGVSIETSSFNVNNSAKLKINSSQNTVYDISVSPSSSLTDTSSNKMEFQTLKALNDFKTLNNNKEQELVIEAVMKKNNEAESAGAYFGTVEINVNYN